MDFSSLISAVSTSDLIIGITLVGFGLFITTVVVMLIIIKLPSEYTLRESPPLTNNVVTLRYVVTKLVRNILGIILIIFGLIMFLTPGQGLLTVFIGLLLVDFPGKHKLISKIITHKKILTTINHIRIFFKKAPIVVNYK